MTTLSNKGLRAIIQSICACGTVIAIITLMLDAISRTCSVAFIFVLNTIALTLHWVNSQEK